MGITIRGGRTLTTPTKSRSTVARGKKTTPQHIPWKGSSRITFSLSQENQDSNSDDSDSSLELIEVKDDLEPLQMTPASDPNQDPTLEASDSSASESPDQENPTQDSDDSDQGTSTLDSDNEPEIPPQNPPTGEDTELVTPTPDIDSKSETHRQEPQTRMDMDDNNACDSGDEPAVSVFTTADVHAPLSPATEVISIMKKDGIRLVDQTPALAPQTTPAATNVEEGIVALLSEQRNAEGNETNTAHPTATMNARSVYKAKNRYKMTHLGGHENPYKAIIALDKRHPGIDFRITQSADSNIVLTPQNEDSEHKLAGHLNTHNNLPAFQQVPIEKKETKGFIHGFPSAFPLEVLTDHPAIIRATWTGTNTNALTRRVLIICSGALPVTIDLGKFGKYKPKKPNPEPIRCFKCQRFGHHSKTCGNPVKCGVCSGSHLSDICINKYHRTGEEGKAKCPNCSAEHHAWSRNCPARPRMGHTRDASSNTRHSPIRRYEDAPAPQRSVWDRLQYPTDTHNSRRKDNERDRTHPQHTEPTEYDPLEGTPIDQFFPRQSTVSPRKGKLHQFKNRKYRKTNNERVDNQSDCSRSTSRASAHHSRVASTHPEDLHHADQDSAERTKVDPLEHQVNLQRTEQNRETAPQDFHPASPPAREGRGLIHLLKRLMDFLEVPSTSQTIVMALVSPLMTGIERYIREIATQAPGEPATQRVSVVTHVTPETTSDRTETDTA